MEEQSGSQSRKYWCPRRTSMCTSALLLNNSLMMTSSFSMWLCTRRILRFLDDHFLDGTAHQLEQESTAFFNLAHFEYLAKSGRFEEADRYVLWFIPLCERPSPQADAFYRWFNAYRNLAGIARGGRQADFVVANFPLLDDDAAKANPAKAKYNAFLHRFHRSPKDPNFLEELWDSAVKKLRNLAAQCPELKRKLHQPPQYAPKSWQINLSGVRPVPRPYKKKKQLTKPQVLDAIRFFAQKRHEININLQASQEKEETHMTIPGPSATPVLAPLLSNSSALGATVAPAMLGEDANEDVSKSLTQKMSVLMDTEAD